MKLKLNALPVSETNFASMQFYLKLDANQAFYIKSLLSKLVQRLLEKQYIDINTINAEEVYSTYFTIVNEVTATGGMPMGYPGATFNHFISIHAGLVLLFREISGVDPLFYEPGYELLAQHILKSA